MNLKYLYINTIFLLLSSYSYAEIYNERLRILDKRINKVQFYHLGVGIDISYNNNYLFAPKVFIGIGSNRNLYNLDVGVKIECSNLFGTRSEEYIRYYHMPFFLSASLNAIRWKDNSFYIGAEILYNISLGSTHHVKKAYKVTSNQNVSNNHVSCQVKLGFRCKCWDFSTYYENDFSPALDQKYVYESIEYDYLKVYPSIFERSRIGVCFAYNFRF